MMLAEDWRRVVVNWHPGEPRCIRHHAMKKKLILSDSDPGLIKRAEVFFTNTAASIMKTDGTAQESKAGVKGPNDTLRQRTAELAASNCQLQRRIARHRAKENAFKKRGQHRDHCLQESLQLEKHLRRLTHRVLAAQEDERKTISLELQNETAQTLLGINVRLFSLKQQARGNTQGLRNKIVSTQQLVLKSVQYVRQFAHELDIGPATKQDRSVKTP